MNKNKFFSHFSLVILLLFFLFFDSSVFAMDMYRIEPGDIVMVDEHETCRMVRNRGNEAILVPTKTAEEWEAFRIFRPPHVDLYSCIFSLSGNTRGSGSGTIRLNPPSVVHSGSFAEEYLYGTSVNLRATPHTGSTFNRWEGSCSGTSTTCSLKMEKDKSVTAWFDIITHVLTGRITGPGYGVIRLTPPSIRYSSDFERTYNYGTLVTLRAIAGSSAEFHRWGGACSGSSVTCEVSMTRARSVTAHFCEEVCERRVTGQQPGCGNVIRETVCETKC